MRQLKKVKVVPVKGTSEAEIEKHRRPRTALTSRSQTIDVFLKRETLEGISISLNQAQSKLNLTERQSTATSPRRYETSVKRKVSRYIQERVRKNGRHHLKSADLWGDSYYKNVMKQSNLTEEFFLKHHEQICERKPVPIGLLSLNVSNVFELHEEEKPLVLRRMDSRKAHRLRKKSQEDMQSMLLTLSKRKQRQQSQKKHRNLYKDLSDMLRKKMVDFRVSISETAPQEFENLRRCQNYCHLVQKNLIPEFRFSGSYASPVKDRTSTSRTSRIQTKVEPNVRRETSPEKAVICESIQRIMNEAKQLKCARSSCELQQEFNAFQTYNSKIDSYMEKRWECIAKLR